MIKVSFVDLLNLYNDHHGVYAMASVLKKENVSTSFISTRNFKKALEQLRKIDPDLVCYSSFSATIPLYVSFDRLMKGSFPRKSVIGGPGPTYDADSLKDSTIDAICVGEGELALVDFVDNGFKATKNIFYRTDPFPTEFYPFADLNQLPFPDRSPVYAVDALLKDSPSKQFFSGRGCPYNCSYCFNHKFREMFKGCGSGIRKKDVGYLIEEINQVKHLYPLKEVIFNDDLFIVDKAWFREFSQRYPKEVGLPYTCNVRANLVNDEIADGLKQSLCRGVNWSVETGDDYLRNTVLNRGISDEQIFQAADCLSRHRVPYRVGNVLGLPGETLEKMDKTIAMNIRIKPYIGLANVFVPFPGLKLTQYAMEQGFYSEVIKQNLPKDYFSQSRLNFSPRTLKLIYKRFCLFPWFVRFPFLFNKEKIRHFLLILPAFVLRVLYEFIYTYKLAKFCIPRTSFRLKCRMAFRHLKNL